MNGYPVGTKVVITHMRLTGDTNGEAAGMRIGNIVTVMDPAGATPGYPNHQGVNIKHPYTYQWIIHRVEWMRPIDGDITNDDLDVVEMYKSPVKAIETNLEQVR